MPKKPVIPTMFAADAALDDVAEGVAVDVAEPVARAMEPDSPAVADCASVWTVSPVAFVQETLLEIVTLLRRIKSAHCKQHMYALAYCYERWDERRPTDLEELAITTFEGELQRDVGAVLHAGDTCSFEVYREAEETLSSDLEERHSSREVLEAQRILKGRELNADCEDAASGNIFK